MIEEGMAGGYARRVGDRLRAIRKQKGLSLQEVEASSTQEFKASVLGAYERGGAAALSVLIWAAWRRSSAARMPTAAVHSRAARAWSMGQPTASSYARRRGASPARRKKCARASARSSKVRATREVAGTVTTGL